MVLTFVVNDLLETFSIFDHQYEPTGILAPAKVWLRRNSNLYRFAQNVYWRVAQEARRARDGQAEPLRKRDRLEERLATLDEIVRRTRASGALFLLVLYPDNLDDPVSPGPSDERLTMRQELVRYAGGQACHTSTSRRPSATSATRVPASIASARIPIRAWPGTASSPRRCAARSSTS